MRLVLLTVVLVLLGLWAGCSVGLTLRLFSQEEAAKEEEEDQKIEEEPPASIRIRRRMEPQLRGSSDPKEKLPLAVRGVHAFYYPWYGTPETDGAWAHWNHEHLPHWDATVQARYPPFRHDPTQKDIGAAFYPRLGPYSSNDATIVDDHARQARLARIGVLVVSWYPSTHNENVDEAIGLILEAAAKFGLEVCFHLEPYEGRTALSVRKDVDLVLETYATHRAYHRIDGKPVFYAYDSYQISPNDWTAAFHGARIFFICLVLDKKHLSDYLLNGGPFDAAYTYFGATSFTYASNPKHWTDLANLAKSVQKEFIPCVAPGYDDLSVRPWNGQNRRERRNGDYYDDMWQNAIDARASIVAITSFNEWHEGTQIEEAVPFSTAGGKPYLDYGIGHPPTFYLDKTRDWVSKFEKSGDRSSSFVP